jgi:hypothetical protein
VIDLSILGRMSSTDLSHLPSDSTVVAESSVWQVRAGGLLSMDVFKLLPDQLEKHQYTLWKRIRTRL